jgi:hypothetical protein
MLTSLLQSAHTVRSVSPVAVRRGQCATNVTETSLLGAQYFYFVFARLQFPTPTPSRVVSGSLVFLHINFGLQLPHKPQPVSFTFFLFIIH